MTCTVFPMNLDWDAVDANGIPLNPDWCYHKENWAFWGLPPQAPNPRYLCGDPNKMPWCTNQPTYTDSAPVCAFAGNYWYVPGHWNWKIPGTYRGWVSWVDQSSGFPFDDYDYNLDMLPWNAAGLTVGNNKGRLLLEFDRLETTAVFHSWWWEAFHSAVEDSDARARRMLGNPFAIASGLIGIDTAHPSCGAELHPVWALAIQTDLTENAERWPMFVRNWGNEGFCSQSQHYLGLQDYTFTLPWRHGATGVEILNVDFRRNNSTSSVFISAQFGEAVFVRFTLPPPRERGWVNGSVWLQWEGAPRAVEVGPPLGERTKPASPIERLFKQMTPKQREIYKQQFRKRLVVHHESSRPPITVTSAQSFRPVAQPPTRSEPPQVWSEIDHNKVAENYECLRALNAAFDGKIPGLPPLTGSDDG
jgi:hypothetical protein